MKKIIFYLVMNLIGLSLFGQCPLPPSSFIGDYELEQTTPVHPQNGVPSFNDQVVTLSQGSAQDKRVFSAVFLENLGIGQDPMNVSFLLDCNNGDVVVDSDLDTYLTCSGNGNITLGPAATTGSFTVNDDSSFTLILAEYVNDGGCGVSPPLVTEFTLTKNCSKPQNVEFLNATPNSVNMSWLDTNDTSSTGNTYSVEYGLQDFSLGTGQTITGISGNSTVINNLQPDTTYDFYVFASCTDGTSSQVAGPFEYVFFDNPDFTLAANGVTCLCPNANFGDTGTFNINGIPKTITKRTRAQLDALIANDINDPQIALTCTSGITDMSNLFEYRFDFNQNINHWDVSNVTDMSWMFHFADAFDQPLNNWDMSNVTDISYMFNGAEAFNKPLYNWNVSNVTDMRSMFSGADAFNQPLSTWNVSNVTDMSGMFTNATSFNQPLDNWDVSNVTDMSSMFANAASFNHALDNWGYDQDVQLSGFLNSSHLNISNYEDLLQHFDVLGFPNKTLGALSIAYCDDQARNNLIDNKGWTINGDVQGQCGQTFNPSTTPFVTTWNVDDDAPSIDIYTADFYDYDFSIDWGDGQVDQNVTADINHTYASSGTYTVSITGVFPYFKVCDLVRTSCDNAAKLSSVESWGDQEWRYMLGSFSQAENLVLNTTQVPNLNNVESLRSMFEGAANFDQPINNWDVSNVTDMSTMFEDATSFNQPLNNWAVSNVTDMSFMFRDATSFNQPLNNWDVSNVTDMSFMFFDAAAFDQPLNIWDVSNVTDMRGLFGGFDTIFNQPLIDWDTSNVTDMAGMFLNNISYNQNLNYWDVSNVTTMRLMFNGAVDFNQPLNNWAVSNVTDMSFMFRDATSFNQPLNNWDVSNVTDMSFMFFDAAAFDQPLNIWDVSNVTDMRGLFGGSDFDTIFNQPLNDWDVSSVTDMSFMFQNNTSFNQPLNNWDVSSVTFMSFMFFDAAAFDQDISGWCVEQIPTAPTDFSTNCPLQDSFKPDWGATCTLGVQDNELAELELYPNPTLNKVYFTIPEGMEIERIEVFNMLGQKVKEKSVIVQDDVFVDLSELASGNYFIQVRTRDNQQLTSRLIKQ